VKNTGWGGTKISENLKSRMTSGKEGKKFIRNLFSCLGSYRIPEEKKESLLGGRGENVRQIQIREGKSDGTDGTKTEKQLGLERGEKGGELEKGKNLNFTDLPPFRVRGKEVELPALIKESSSNRKQGEEGKVFTRVEKVFHKQK